MASMAAALLISLTLLLILRPQPQLQAAELRIRILRGNITFSSSHGSNTPTTHGQGFHVLWIRPGDRIRTGPLDSSIALDEWGQIQLDPYTTLEFKTLETVTMNGKTIATSVLLGVLAGTGTWYGLNESQAVEANDSIEVGFDEEKAALLKDFEKRERELLAENTLLKEEILALKNQGDRKEITVTETAEEPKKEEAVVMKVAAPSFTTAEYAEALSKVDWDVMGASMQQMLPLLAQLMEEWEKTGEPSIELAGKIQSLNGALLQQLPVLLDGGVPGSGANGTFTHPLVVSNQVVAMLRNAGIPLNKTQMARLKALSASYSTEDEVQRLSSAKDEAGLVGILAETGVKGRFYEALRGVLSEDQIAKLYPEALRGRTQSDLLSTGLVWAQYARPVPSKGPADLQKNISGKISSSLGLDASQRKQLDGIVSKWAREFPTSLWSKEASFHQKIRRFQNAEVRRNAERQLALIRNIVDSMNLTPKQRSRILSSKSVFMPISSK